MFINTETREYPVTEGHIRSQYPNTSFPSLFEPPLPYMQVHDVLRPEFDQLSQYVQEVSPIEANGRWERQYQVMALDADKIAENQINANAVITRQIIESTQARLDNFARTRNYDGILSACTYVTSGVVRFQAEAHHCIELRDATWSALYMILDEVTAGTRPAPTGYTEIESELPALTWPE